MNTSLLNKYGITAWHKAGYTGKGIKIAVLDGNGAPYEHMKSYAFDPFGTLSGIGHICNTAQVVHTFAPDAEIYMMDYKGDYERRAQMRQFVIDNKIDLINVSLLSADPCYLKEFKDLDIPIVCASGNSGNPDNMPYPAKHYWTIACGAWNDTGGWVEWYSQGGELLDCVSFTDIFVKNAVDSWFTFGGTSCAAPSLTGQLACYFQKQKLNRNDTRAFIHGNTKDLLIPGHDYKSGWGLFILPEVVTTPTQVIMDKPAKIIDGRFYCVARFFVEALGGTAEWVADTKTGIFRLNGKTIYLQDGSNVLTVE